jgi:hypothetical protein
MARIGQPFNSSAVRITLDSILYNLPSDELDLDGRQLHNRFGNAYARGLLPGGLDGAAAFFVGRIYHRIQTMLKMRAHRCCQMSSCRKAEDANLVRINVPRRCVISQ